MNVLKWWSGLKMPEQPKQSRCMIQNLPKIGKKKKIFKLQLSY